MRLHHEWLYGASVGCALVFTLSRGMSAQDADPRPVKPDSTPQFPNTTAGELTPGRGFDIIKTDMGTLNISAYGLFRFINQSPGGQKFIDHLGRERAVNPRNDLNWHRTMIWVNGWFWSPKLRYTITTWGLATTQQSLIFGNVTYTASDAFTVGVGISPSLTARSLQGSWPFWAGSDRQMGEEYFRGGFASGIWFTGQIVPRLTYTLAINNEISELGVSQANDTRQLFYSGSLRWQPTTGEFGARNGFGDFEYHKKAATQFGISTGTGKESRYAPLDQAPNNTQIKISDGLNVFELGALADGVTVETTQYTEAAVDAGVKYRGWSFESEYYWRRLNNFIADGPLPLTAVKDHGLMGRIGYMAMPKKLNVYALSSYIDDQFHRYPWEAGGGANFYPSKTRSLRLNLQLIHVHKSAASSYFGYYLAGQTGLITSFGMDILL